MPVLGARDPSMDTLTFASRVMARAVIGLLQTKRREHVDAWYCCGTAVVLLYQYVPRV